MNRQWMKAGAALLTLAALGVTAGCGGAPAKSSPEKRAASGAAERTLKVACIATYPPFVYKDKEDKPVLVFSDVHAPFDHKRYPDFLRDTYKRFGCGRVICLGDLVDNHAISGHMTEPCALGAYTELDLAISRLKIYTAIFPDVDYCKGNHDLRVDRMAASVGIGRRYLRDFQEVLELPEGWVCHGDEFIANGILYSHGVDAAGKNGAINKALRERMSVAVGHSHAYGGCQQSANKRDAVFGLNVGCGIDDEAYAFVYGKHSRNRVTLGCGVVFGPEQAIFVPMGKEYS